MVKRIIQCPNCNFDINIYHNPVPTVDIIIEYEHKIVLIERKNHPPGWAIPGGFVDYGETVEQAAIREAKEETGLDCDLVSILGVYSDPARDDRLHTISTVFIAEGYGKPEAADDALSLKLFSPGRLPHILSFDHAKILADYIKYKAAVSK